MDGRRDGSTRRRGTRIPRPIGRYPNAWSHCIGRAIGLEDDTQAAVDRFDSDVAKAATEITLPPQPTTALVYVQSDQGANVWTADSAQSKLLTVSGFIMADIPDSVRADQSMGMRKDIVQVSAENLYDALAGNTVILVNAGDATVSTVKSLPILARHPAVTEGHVYAVGTDTFRLDYYSATNMVNRLVEQFS